MKRGDFLKTGTIAAASLGAAEKAGAEIFAFVLDEGRQGGGGAAAAKSYRLPPRASDEFLPKQPISALSVSPTGPRVQAMALETSGRGQAIAGFAREDLRHGPLLGAPLVR
jgi:hypothetical protein